MSRIRTFNNGELSEKNSSSVTLGPGEPFIGVGEKVTEFVEVRVAVKSDVPSATNGLRIEYSTDNVNWDHDDSYTVPANTGKNYGVQRVAEYYRIVYTNGGTIQTTFRLSTIFNRVAGMPSSHKTSDDVTSEDDAQLQKSIMMVATNDPEIYRNADVQNPLSTDGDSVYPKDLDISFCTAADFIKDADPSLTEADVINSMVSDIYIEKLNSTSDAVKTVFLQFQRPVLTSSFGINAGPGGDFSNVKITLAQGDFSFVAVDESADSTKHQIRLFSIIPVKFSRMTIEFFTTDSISIGLIGIFKNVEVAARIEAVSELTNEVENVNSFRGALNVNQAIVHKIGINAKFHRLDGVSTTTTAAITEGDITFPVASVAGLAIGNKIQVVTDDPSGETFLTITNIAALVITGDQPFPCDVVSGVVVDKIETDMTSTVGTLASPVIYSVHPPAGAVWQITRIMISLTDGSAMDDGKFGGITALTNGVLLRNESIACKNLTLWKSNGDLALDMYDVTYTTKAPSGENGLRGRWTFTRGEFVVELDGDLGHSLDFYVQDDITANSSLVINAQGRLFGG